MTALNEGLSRNALKDLVLPMISIDEYESKVSDKHAVVVAFFVGDEDPANDLSGFIDRSGHAVLDTEISPAPTIDGQYVVFVEIQRNGDFPEVLIEIMEDVENLCGIGEWTFQCPGRHDPIDLSEENIMEMIVLDPDSIPDEPAEEDGDYLSEFFSRSAIKGIIVDGRNIIFEHQCGMDRFEMVTGSGNTIDIGSERARRLQHLLGPAYSVFATESALIIEHGGDQVFLKND